MIAPPAEKTVTAPSKQYFYSADPNECAGCGRQIGKERAVGTLTFNTPGQPTLHYAVCRACSSHLDRKRPGVIDKFEELLMAQAEKLGIVSRPFSPDSRTGVLS